MTAPAVQNVRSRQEWAEIINADWRKSIESIIQTGRDLDQAAHELRGEYKKMVEEDLPFSLGMADKLRRVARHPEISDSSTWTSLPPSWTVLSQLSKLTPEDFDDARKKGLVSPDMRQASARAISDAYRKPEGETIGAGRKPATLPSPGDARKIARETGRLVSASDGYMYSGTTEEEGDEYVRQREARYRAMEAMQTLANMDMTPHEWLHEGKPHWFVQFSLSDIEGAMAWLEQLRKDYCEKEGIVDHV